MAGSIGPTGLPARLRRPRRSGKIRFRELVEVFTEQAEGLIEGGVDLLIIETAQDILEVKAAVFGARAAFKSTGKRLPIQCSVSLLPNGGKMLLGTDIQAVLTTLAALDVDVIGLNCSTGPEDMRDAIRYLGEYSRCRCTASPTPASRTRAPTARRSSPSEPEPLANALQEFVERFGVGDRGRLLRHHARPHRGDRGPRGRPKPVKPRPEGEWCTCLSSMMTATPLAQEPAPTLVGERVNSQGSRKAKEMLLDDDYDGLVTVAEDQVTAARTCSTSASRSPSARTRTSRCGRP